jgi:hypothetical protein
MTRDEWIMASLVLAFATLATVHVTLVAGLIFRRWRWRALAAAVVFPLAPYWGARAGMHTRAVLWVASAASYAVALWVTSR